MLRSSLVASVMLLGACQEFKISGDYGLSGKGDAPSLATPTKTDVVRQTTVPQVDILWVVDNSGSMAEEQDELRTNFDAFINFFVGSGLDYHVGVVTTDVDARAQNGKLQPARDGTRFLTPESVDPSMLFRQMVSLGTLGSADERGIAAAYKAIAQPQADIAQVNAGFYRDEAALHIVVVSDEENTSGVISRNEFINYLQNLKASSDTPVTFSSIVGPEPRGCSRLPEVDAVAGSEYIRVSEAVGGIIESICTQDWYGVLEELGLQAAGLKREYFLTDRPIRDTIEVRIVDEGVERYGIDLDLMAPEAPLDGVCRRRGYKDCFGFTYDARRNSVYLPDYLPGALADVAITYELLSAAEPGLNDSDAEEEAEE